MYTMCVCIYLSLSLSLCIYIYIYMCVCVYVCVYINMCVYIDMGSTLSHTHSRSKLAVRVDEDWPGVLADLTAIRTALLGRKGAMVNMTADERTLTSAGSYVSEFLASLPEAGGAHADWGLTLARRNEAIIVPTQVCVVVLVGVLCVGGGGVYVLWWVDVGGLVGGCVHSYPMVHIQRIPSHDTIHLSQPPCTLLSPPHPSSPHLTPIPLLSTSQPHTPLLSTCTGQLCGEGRQPV